MVMEVVQEDMGEGNMQCIDHPYKNSSPGGICAFCLQEKLGKLVSSSFTVAIFPSSSSSSSPSSASFRSKFGARGGSIITTTNASSSSSNLDANASSHHIDDLHNDFYTRRSKVPFLFKRSKSTTTPKRGDISFLDADEAEDYSPYRKGFWPFIYLSSKNSNTKKYVNSSYASSSSVSKEKKKQGLEVVDENDDECPDQEVALDHRKVSRSRSVGCGSRSFSGDFFERISTGFGDCTLRRVESQRENKPKVASMHRERCAGQDCIKERVKCGGIFSGFIVASSSSSSYWVNSSSNEDSGNCGRSASTPGRSKNHWGWSFASPMRAFGKPSNNNGKRREASNKNVTPNLAAIPSLLAVSG